MIQFHYRGELIARPVRLIGIDPEGRARTGGFAEYLVRQKDHPQPSFTLDDKALAHYKRHHAQLLGPRRPFGQMMPPPSEFQPFDDAKPAFGPPPVKPAPEPWTRPEVPELYVPPGIIVGNAVASFRDPEVAPGEKPKDFYILQPGDDVVLTTVSGQRLAPVFSRFVVCDYFKSEMSEYDSQYVFVPLDYLQRLRTMEGRVTGIQIRLTDYRDARAVVARLKEMFGGSGTIQVTTWEDKQGALLAAIAIEKGLLNVLLFLIIAVAGFGILAIFSMIVTEKTRDIGILKALGASSGGVMTIFLGYGLLLGLVGAGLGTGLGLALTLNINAIEQGLTKLTGQEIFPRQVYYFSDIPTDIQPWAVLLVNLGALAIAVAFSVLPALRAALLHPVRALRYE
jgi:lipoprotein-releasing system permease protein